MGKAHGCWFGLALVVTLVNAGPSRADLTIFQGIDTGIGPGSPTPNTDSAAASFRAFAGALGSGNTITFEGLPLGTPAENSSLSVAPGVALTLSNTDQSVIPGFPFGVSNASPRPVFSGYNSTHGGSNFLEFVPNLGVGVASANFHFQTPVRAFGLVLTGVGSVAADIHLMFSDGTLLHDLTISGVAAGGIQFFGFADPGAAITDVRIEERNVPMHRRDVFGLDDVQYATIPEPSSAILLGLGLLGFVLVRRNRRRAHAH